MDFRFGYFYQHTYLNLMQVKLITDLMMVDNKLTVNDL
jgi:hypothetical protein